MTCIVGIAMSGEGAVLGSDSLAGNDDTWKIVATPKLYEVRSWLAFGFTTSWRFGQLLGHGGLDRAIRDGDETGSVEFSSFDWLVGQLVPAMRAALDEGGYMRKRDERETAGTAVVAVRDRVFKVQEDFSVLEYADGVAACGYGEREARTAAAVARDLEPSLGAPEVAGLALKHAAAASPWVSGPFHFVVTAMR